MNKLMSSLSVIVAAFVLSQSAMADMPQSITFTFSNSGTVTAVGRKSGFGANAFRPVYLLNFKHKDGVGKADLTLNWNWPGSLSFTFFHHGNQKTCTGQASLQGNLYTGTMTCPSASYSVTLQ